MKTGDRIEYFDPHSGSDEFSMGKPLRYTGKIVEITGHGRYVYTLREDGVRSERKDGAWCGLASFCNVVEEGKC